MRATLHLLLAAACVSCLVGEALANCADASWGDTNERWGVYSVVVDSLVVDLHENTDISVNIPFDPKAKNCNTVGVRARFCEAERIRFTHDFTVLAHLPAGNTDTKGLLSSVVYCSLWNGAVQK